MGELIQMKCEACRRDAPRVTAEETQRLRVQIPDWSIVEREEIQRLERTFTFPDFAEALNNRGAAYEALEDDAGAKENYLRAILAEPKFAAAYYNLACLYSKSDNLDLCLDYLRQAVELEPPLAEEAADDENLGWVLELDDLRRNSQ